MRSGAMPAWSRAVLGALALAAVVFVPVVAALVALARPQWFPTGDLAQAELHVRGFWSHPPLVGAAGRIQDAAGVQGAHPGPALWLAMWPLYAALGGSSQALMLSVATVHLATAVLALWLAWRRGGVALAVLLAGGLAVVVRAGGPDMLTEPWNPWMGLLPFVVFVLACWSSLEGDWWALPLAVAAGSYSIQTHAGYLLVVTGVLLFAVIAVAAQHWVSQRASVVRSIAAAVVVGVVMWLPPLVDQLRRSPGNLSILRSHFGDPDGPYLGLADVAEIAVVQFNVLGPWVFGARRQSITIGALVGFVAFVVLWAAAVRSTIRRGAAAELRLHALLGAACVLAIVSITRIFGRYLEYTIRWVWLLTVMVVAASVWSLWRGRPAVGPRVRPRLVAVAAASAAAVVVVVASLQFATRATPTGAADSRIVGGLVPQVVDDLDPSERHLLRWWDPALLGAIGFGTVLELERRGFQVGVDRQFSAAVQPHRVQPETTADVVLYLVLGDTSIERARATTGLVELGGFEPRSSDERRRSAEVRQAIEARLTDAGQADRIALLDEFYGQAQLLFNEPAPPPEVVELLREYIDLRQPAVLFRAEPGTAVLPL